MLQEQPSSECAHHVLRTVREVDDVQHPEDDRQTETQKRIERSVDQAEQKLAEQRLRRHTQQLEHLIPLAGGKTGPSRPP